MISEELVQKIVKHLKDANTKQERFAVVQQFMNDDEYDVETVHIAIGECGLTIEDCLPTPAEMVEQAETPTVRCGRILQSIGGSLASGSHMSREEFGFLITECEKQIVELKSLHTQMRV
jgi:hypothetical protein